MLYARRGRPGNDLRPTWSIASSASTAVTRCGWPTCSYVPAGTGFLYLAVVIDASSRKMAGWFMGERMTAKLVLGAVHMALHTRKPDSVIHHSDQGSQDTSIAFGSRCQEMNVDSFMAVTLSASFQRQVFDPLDPSSGWADSNPRQRCSKMRFA